MAKRPSVKEILEAARKAGPAQPAEEATATPAEEPVVEAAAEPVAPEEPAAAPAAPANVPSPATLGRPLTLKEKLAAARSGGAPQPAAARPAAPAAAASAAPAEAEEEAAPVEAPKAPPPPAKPLGRPMTLAEKLAAARGAAGSAPAAAAKPAAAKAAPAAKPAAAARALPPLDKITDPKDLAEAARQAAARRAKEEAAAKAAAAPPKAKPAPAKPQTVPPRPGRELAAAGAEPRGISRRGFYVFSLFLSWLAVAWITFTAGMAAMTLMTVRFMFPNVLAEPPSTIKIGLPTNYDPEDVSDRFKAEWGFWVVRSNRYNGQDIIYAIQSVCTHLGCPPNWLASEQKFKCPCHGSGFYISGINFEGPAPRPLERFKVSLADDGQIMVDKSQKFQEELGQWSDPDSFIPA
jgi:cytochrome b6-f complex iron-sulfur subunit